MTGILLVLTFAILTEALVEYGKSVAAGFTSGEWRTATTQVVAIVVSVLLCFLGGADIFGILDVELAVPWAGVLLTGILASRGANYVNDLIERIRNLGGGEDDV